MVSGLLEGRPMPILVAKVFRGHYRCLVGFMATDYLAALPNLVFATAIYLYLVVPDCR
jgi:hypothetical protein